MKKMGILLLVSFALLTTGLAPATGAIRVGVVRVISTAGVFIALEKGYFKEQGLDVQLIDFRSAALMMAPISTGELEVGAGGLSAGFYNAIRRGMPVVVVADKGSQPPGFGFSALVVRKDLWDSGEVKSVKDLKGRVVATNATGGVNIFEWSRFLALAGLTIKDAEFKIMPFPEMVTALGKKAIDAAVIVQPLVTVAEARGVGVKLMSVDQAEPGEQTAVIFYSRDWARKNPEPARKFMVAYMKGLRFYNDALKEKGAKFDELIGILSKHTPVRDRALYEKMVWAGLNPNGYVNKESIMEMQKFFVDNGWGEGIVPIEQLVDESFIEHAIKVLGRYGG